MILAEYLLAFVVGISFGVGIGYLLANLENFHKEKDKEQSDLEQKLKDIKLQLCIREEIQKALKEQK